MLRKTGSARGFVVRQSLERSTIWSASCQSAGWSTYNKWEDHGFMYAQRLFRIFFDGHILEVFLHGTEREHVKREWDSSG